LQVTYLKLERCPVARLTFYKLRFFRDDKEFIINKYIFSDLYPYFYKDVTLIMTDNNNLKISSTKKNVLGKISFEINDKSKYKISFKLQPDSVINIKIRVKNTGFLYFDKLIEKDQLEIVDVEISTKNQNDILDIEIINDNLYSVSLSDLTLTNISNNIRIY
jgi:hypothetical protein